MKILLTGPTGFVGSTFTRFAVEQGHEIAGLVIPSEAIPADLPASKDLRWLRGTLTEAPWDEIKAFGPDVCVHMAWITTPGIYLESPLNEQFRDDSLSFLKNVEELGTRYILSLGTCVEYQITNEILSEERTPVVPTTLYARCKNELRLAMEAEAGQRGFGFGWARVFYPYGPREHPSRLCSSIIDKLKRDEKIVLKTPESTKDYIYIEDLSNALLTVLEKRYRGTINLGTGTGLSVREIAQTIGVMIGKPQLIEHANPPQVDPMGYVVADVTRLRALGWRPAYDLKQGLEKLMEAKTAN
jgi:nucleoside-diphosphate-sugar epimerase